jgi:hypothetical protein
MSSAEPIMGTNKRFMSETYAALRFRSGCPESSMITNLLWTVLLVSAQTPTPADTLRQLDSAWARSYATNDTVVIGLAEWSWTFNGRTNVTRLRYTAVYARGGSLGWRMVALHMGPAPE